MNLLEKRTELNLTQKQVAELMCVKISTVHQWETGKRKMSPAMIRLFELCVDSLLNEQYSQHIDNTTGETK